VATFVPFRVADVAFVEVQVRVAFWPAMMAAGCADNDTVGIGGGGGDVSLPDEPDEPAHPARTPR
jgi:hypothetical protein